MRPRHTGKTQRENGVPPVQAHRAAVCAPRCPIAARVHRIRRVDPVFQRPCDQDGEYPGKTGRLCAPALPECGVLRLCNLLRAPAKQRDKAQNHAKSRVKVGKSPPESAMIRSECISRWKEENQQTAAQKESAAHTPASTASSVNGMPQSVTRTVARGATKTRSARRTVLRQKGKRRRALRLGGRWKAGRKAGRRTKANSR